MTGQKTGTKISSSTLSVKSPEEVDSLPEMLTTTEKEVLSALLSREEAVTTLMVRHYYLVDDIENRLSFASDLGHDKERHYRELNRISDEIFSKTDGYKTWGAGIKLDRELKKLGIPEPSHRTISKTLISLLELGLVCQRSVAGDAKSKFLWFVNPSFRKLWNDRRGQIMNECKNKRELLESKYGKLVDFYGIDKSSSFFDSRRA